MHWFWRAMIGAVLGFVIAILAGMVVRTWMGGATLSSFGLAILFGTYFAAFLIGTSITSRLSAKRETDSETRCRKCGYILRGITEPRCPECGELI